MKLASLSKLLVTLVTLFPSCKNVPSNKELGYNKQKSDMIINAINDEKPKKFQEIRNVDGDNDVTMFLISYKEFTLLVKHDAVIEDEQKDFWSFAAKDKQGSYIDIDSENGVIENKLSPGCYNLIVDLCLKQLWVDMYPEHDKRK